MRDLSLEVKIVDAGDTRIPCACGKSQWCAQLDPCTNLVRPQHKAILGTEGFKSLLELEDKLMTHGGSIVNVDNLSAYELAECRAKGHLLIDDQGRGLAWLPPDESEC